MDEREAWRRKRRGFAMLERLNLEQDSPPLPPATALQRGFELIALAESLATPDPPEVRLLREQEDAFARRRWVRLRRALG